MASAAAERLRWNSEANVMRTVRDPVVVLWAGLAAWIATTLPTWLQATSSPRFPIWLVAWVTFGAAFAAVSRARLPRAAEWAALGVESASVVAMVGLLCNGYEGTLLVLVAAQIALRTAGRVGGLWIAAQSAALAVAIALHWTPHSALLLVPPYIGFQVFGFLVFRLLARETTARHALATSNAELLQLHAQLAERSRTDERLRLAQELHDALGHRLTALSLNLEVAAHQTTGEAQVNVRTAQSLVRLALGDVREIVTTWKPPVDLDLRDELVRMAAEVPEPSIHVGRPRARAGREPRLLACAAPLRAGGGHERHPPRQGAQRVDRAESRCRRPRAPGARRRPGDIRSPAR
jgi:signal transduction histidine kinase